MSEYVIVRRAYQPKPLTGPTHGAWARGYNAGQIDARNGDSPVSIEEIVEVLEFYANPENARERTIAKAYAEEGRDPTIGINNTHATPGYALPKLVVDGGDKARSLLDRLSGGSGG